jgi:transcription elongation factor Elf1
MADGQERRNFFEVSQSGRESTPFECPCCGHTLPVSLSAIVLVEMKPERVCNTCIERKGLNGSAHGIVTLPLSIEPDGRI